VGGVVIEAGPDCRVAAGTRVAVDPTIACVAQGLAPCPSCASGRPATCRNLNAWGHGFGHGFAAGIGGGWSERLVAHQSQLHPAPPDVDDRGLALAEPLAIAAHGVLRRLPVAGEPALVVGAGSIGLAAVAALRALAPRSPVTALARHDHQARAAVALGASVLRGGDDDVAMLAEAVGGRLTGSGRAQMVWGGWPYVVEAAGSAASLELCLKVVGGHGTLLLLGAVNRVSVDLLPVWFKDVDLVGSFGYGDQPDASGTVRHTFDRALDIIAAGGFPPDVVVTHTFPLADVQAALATAVDRASGAIKVQLLP
jgi:threonine dehydrogenase-like Zn-dependent dehydrogenase